MANQSFENEVVEEVLEESNCNQPVVVTLPLDVYNEQADAIKALQADISFMKEQINILIQRGERSESLSAETHEYFEPIKKLMPLKSINELLEFEELLGNKNNEKKFKKFLASFVLFKKPLKEMTMTFIEKFYHLELQTQVNYSGAGAKQALKSLCSTQVLIKSLIDHSLYDSTDDPPALACAEFRYQMQHACNTIGSSERKQCTTNRKRTTRKALSSLKKEPRDPNNEGGVSDVNT
ncbi:uncharacterized protein LOC129727460 [Wyeomyia smithii]|uniref:uncharacterized protein LOC129727460 n=1 Tax=Wyeomyia smithii TaxID=174621 RepID=UPI002467DFB1|nr:uncharacterized protein LOC129727460 [Wyeomyia smithii]